MKKIFLFILLSITYSMIEASNPFFGKYNTPYETAPFDKIKNADYEPAFKKGMKEQMSEINAIADNPQLATFENTIIPFERSGKLLERVSSVFFNLNSAETNDEMMEISERIYPKLSEHQNNILLNEKLFKRVKSVYDRKDQLNLDPESNQLLEKMYLLFANGGANLNDKDKEIYRKLTTDLNQLTLVFGQNVLKETNKYELVLTNEADLAGIPESIREAAAFKAKQKGKEGWIFDLSAPSYLPFMQHAQRRDLRETLYRAYTSRCAHEDELDNRENMRKIANTRLQIAKVLGYKDYADYVLRLRMAANSKNVYDLLDELLAAYKPVAIQEIKEVEGFAIGMEKSNVDIMPWDWSYYAEKLKDAKYGISDEITRPYFPLENVKKGVFGLATELYGITFKPNAKIPVYHPEVEAFEVFDQNGTFLSILYTDFFPRPGKRNGAWMTEFKGQWKENGKDSRPQISLVMNFTPPTETKPALLTYDEVETFLHEFGHALHGMFADGTYESLSGTNVYQDFVELPSQIMENFLSEKIFLDRFAVHYKTGEKIPEELIQKLINTTNFNEAYACVRQLSYSYLDMAWHTLEIPYEEDIDNFEAKAISHTQLLPRVSGTCIGASFSHIFSGGYAVGYYGYKWAEVLDADAYSVFKADGVLSKTVAQRFRDNILSKGGSEDPMSLYIKFRGGKPTIDALLERTGIKKQ